MTVDSNARRQAILFEVAAVATRYEQDITPEDAQTREIDLTMALETVHRAYSDAGHRSAVTELAGRCVAWLEHLATTEAKT